MFKAFHERNQNSKLILVGDGALRSRIELKIAELGLNDAVIMTGKRTDIRAILSGLDIFIMPSFFEGNASFCNRGAYIRLAVSIK